jgi:hypothetical protein
MNPKKLKALAEEYHFTKRKLTVEERNALLESEYAHLIRPDGKFEELFETFLPKEEAEIKETNITPKGKKVKRIHLYPGISRNRINHLVGDLEDHFNIGISNPSLTKIEDVDYELFKEYVKRYIEEQLIDDTETGKYLKNLIGAKYEDLPGEAIYSIMRCLYRAGEYAFDNSLD